MPQNSPFGRALLSLLVLSGMLGGCADGALPSLPPGGEGNQNNTSSGIPANGNSAPVFLSSPSTSAREAVVYEYAPDAFDADGDTVAFALASFPQGMTLTADGSVSWTPTAAQAGSNAVTLTASDGVLVAHLDWTIIVTPAPQAPSPVFVSTPPPSVTVGGTYTYTVSAISTSPVTISVTGNPWWLVFDDTSNTLSGISPALPENIASTTTGNIRVQADDGMSTPAFQDFSIVVDNGWTAEVVDAIYDVGQGSVRQYISMEIDSADSIHIGYYDASTRCLMYATKPQSGHWTIERVDRSPEDTGMYASLALDGNGNAHIAYYDRTRGDLKYASRISGAWKVLPGPIDAAGNVGTWASLDIDIDGHAHVVYRDEGAKTLKYANNTSGQWVVRDAPIDSSGDVGMWASLALDGQCKAHISCRSSTNNSLKYVTNATLSGEWQSEIIDMYAFSGHSGTGFFSSIALDSASNVHIAYYDQITYSLRYASNSHSPWPGPYASGHFQEVDQYGWDSSLLVDNSGAAHMGYYEINNGVLKYATNASGVWARLAIDSSSDVGSHVSIAEDSNGKMHFAYYDNTNGNLKYASQR